MLSSHHLYFSAQSTACLSQQHADRFLPCGVMSRSYQYSSFYTLLVSVCISLTPSSAWFEHVCMCGCVCPHVYTFLLGLGNAQDTQYVCVNVHLCLHCLGVMCRYDCLMHIHSSYFLSMCVCVCVCVCVIVCIVTGMCVFCKCVWECGLWPSDILVLAEKRGRHTHTPK